MNCKQGDLAVVVRSMAGNEGKIVRCLELDPRCVFYSPSEGKKTLPAWRTNVTLATSWGCSHNWIPDAYLRPIRDSDGQDETLTWQPVPTKEAV